MKQCYRAASVLLAAAVSLTAGAALAQSDEDHIGKDKGERQDYPSQEARPDAYQGAQGAKDKDSAHPCACAGEEQSNEPYALGAAPGAPEAQGELQPYDFKPLDTEVPGLSRSEGGVSGGGGQSFGAGVEPFVLGPLEIR